MKGLEFLRELRLCRKLVPLMVVCFICAALPVYGKNSSLYFAGAAHTPASQDGWKNFQTVPDPSAPLDEPQGGKTVAGTPVSKRSIECFPAEPRNIFWQVDRVASGKGGALEPLKFDTNGDGLISDQERNAIRGQNTWMLWGEGNETFWNWLQQHGYGLTDFLIMLDSRKRATRFHEIGLINQPGFKAQTDPQKRILGLYIDQADGAKAVLQQPGEMEFANVKRQLLAAMPKPPANHPSKLFEPYDQKAYDDVIERLPKDGVDYNIYGYPSGVIGMRLFPNPDFFGRTEAADAARKRWHERVENQTDAYYTDQSVNADPELVRPFRPSMTCAFCHVGPHPLAPPDDPEEPDWKNLSSVIGNQYWVPQKIFANLPSKENFLYHFLDSQQPGTIDTSLVSTDHINNANTINAVFEVPARLQRAMRNSPERQSDANMLLPGIEDGFKATNPRHTPRVLLDGSDSIGVFGALARVYLNIGTFYEEWSRCHNPVIGFVPQRPFSVATCEANSVFWRTTQKYRTNFLAAFFTMTPGVAAGPSTNRYDEPVRNATTAPMKFVHTQEGAKYFSADANNQLVAEGRSVFLNNCAMCHSSKQPDEFSLDFSRTWRDRPSTNDKDASHFTLPMDFSEWELFKDSASYKQYVLRVTKLANDKKVEFFRDNLFSTDIRVPVTLVGTNSGRAVATNGMRGQVWDNFSSDEYKNLPPVGPIRFYNPYSDVKKDSLGFNDSYFPPGGGPGYYRPASLVSLWATAPYLHNNALGIYTHDPSVKGRLAAFEDGIRKLLWNAQRVPGAIHPDGDLRFENPDLTSNDPGFVYRTPNVTWIELPGRFIRPAIIGVIGSFWTEFCTTYFWIGLTAFFAALAYANRATHAAFVLTVVAMLASAFLVLSKLDMVFWFAWVLPLAALTLALYICFAKPRPLLSRSILTAFAIGSLALGVTTYSFVGGALGSLKLGPIPKGTPVNLLMNLNPEAPLVDRMNAVFGLARGIAVVSSEQLTSAEALHKFEKDAGAPLLKASKCPDFVLDRGHWFGEALSDEEKEELIAFLKTL